MTEATKNMIGTTIKIRWGTSRGRDTYGYTTCSLSNGTGKRLAACNGGGYDMEGTVLGSWAARMFADELRALPRRLLRNASDNSLKLYGLTFHDPNYDPGKARIGSSCSDRTLSGKAEGRTVEQAEADGDSLGLERYQAFYSASSPIPTKRHTVPLIDGACGVSCVHRILSAIGIGLRQLHRDRTITIYEVVEAKP